MSTDQNKAFALRTGFALAALASSILLWQSGLSLFRSVLIPAFLIVLALVLQLRLRRFPSETLLSYGLGLLAGLGLGVLIRHILQPFIPASFVHFFAVFCPLATTFLVLSLLAEKGVGVWSSSMGVSPSVPSAPTWHLDSSALVDGRVADLVEAGFLEGIFVVPQFVLNELQTISDTADAVRRNRGRRGLDAVVRLGKAPAIRVEISRADYSDVRQVDLKLIEAAKARGARIVTTDFNLAKLAQAQGIHVFNPNEIAAALRPVVLQGETLRVAIIKEGKEPAQGLAYLEDGTTVVVENARRHIGNTIEVIVTGVVQSASGKMIFGRYEEGRSPMRTRNAG